MLTVPSDELLADNRCATILDRPSDPAAESSPPAQVAVSLVSNSRLLGEALASLLAPHVDLQLVGSYPGRPPPAAPLPNPPEHVVLLDNGIGQEMAIAWARYWRGLTPPADVLALELADDGEPLLAYIEAGVGGYTVLGASAADVAEAIRWVRQGLARCSPRLAAELFARLAAAAPNRPATPPTPPLTARELEVLRYINQDLSNQEIADRLVVEVRTVKHHVHNILQKLELRHRWDAARLAIERGWLDPPPSPR